ncbi:MAG TPA: DUF484 family protein [Xanthomonadales bacterium]|nr:DUF484 family protein [Xanthomonadales bacterium]
MSDNKATLQDVVAAYLRRNPDFLKNYPELLEALNLPHASGSASSLIERQVKQLRAQNQDLNRQLNRLMHVAAENEQLMARLHELTLELLSIPQPAAFFEHLATSLRKNFRADIVKVVLFDGDLAAMAGKQVMWLDADDDKAKMFNSQLGQAKPQTTCGRLNESKLAILFEDKAQWVKSVALAPIGKNGEDGILAIGSSDPTRFYPGMGTLFLDLLADVIASSLANVQPQEQRRTA